MVDWHAFKKFEESPNFSGERLFNRAPSVSRNFHFVKIKKEITNRLIANANNVVKEYLSDILE